MAMPKMFRDRVVSMEQTWELGEKYLQILAELVHEAMPGFRMVGHDFDHDRDFFFLTVKSSEPDEEKQVSFTRMVLADRACVPLAADELHTPVRERLVEAIRSQAQSREIVVAFRSVLSEEDRTEADEIDAAWRAEEVVREAARRAEEEKRQEEKRRQRELEEARRRSQREKGRSRGGAVQAPQASQAP
ncbi:MAG: hypothetical protein IPP07_27010, partial [Holophagales bacterium]|nr:hypothetical protein [Holophagales bacterium]